MPTSYASAPTFTVASLPFTEAIPVIFFLIFLFWVVYTLIASYHWLRYSNNPTLAYSAILMHVIVSAWFAIYAVSGIH